MALNIDNTQTALAIPVIFRLAFRPLFLGGTLFSIIAIGFWIFFWLQPFEWTPYGGHTWWHGHEMIFGFGTAIVAGFLLTAVANWTGIPGLRGKPLATLTIIWLLGRLLLAIDFGLPNGLIASVDIAYMLFVTIAMAYPVIRVKQWQNLMFVPILLLFTLLNASSHWAILNNEHLLAIQFLHATIMLFTLLIAVLGGRVIPAFTSNTTDCRRKTPVKWLEVTSIASILIMIVIFCYGIAHFPPIFLFVISTIAAIVNFIRFSRWGIQHSFAEPLLWSLHLAYLFIPVGFAMLALNSIGLMSNTSAALHSFTVGSIGGMILAMISRVSLGHTGRPLQINAFITLAYVSLLVAALVRAVIPAWLPEFYTLGIAVSGVLWVLAFCIFVYFYGPILLKSRVDGHPG